MSSGVTQAADRGWAGVAVLGLLTITSFGSWFYGFGVLIDPIHEDVGWSTTTLGVTYGAAQVIAGIGAFAGGRLLDRHGGVGPFALQAVAGGGLMLVASWAEDAVVFGLLYAVGAGVTGATGFYSVTTVAAARLRSDCPERAISVLTVIGAFASPIYLPMTAWLVTTWDWRVAARVLSALAIGGAVVAAVVARGGASPEGSRPSARPLAALRSTVRLPAVRRMLAVYLTGGIAFTSVLVYQVPILTGAGISLGAAGLIGGLRGFCQVFGRVGLTTMVERFGAGALLRLAYAVSGIGVAFLLAGTLPAGVAYAVVAGVALGASSPLQAIYARSHFDEGDLGLLMGLQAAALGIAGGVGPLLGGILRDATGSWTPTVLMCVGALSLSAWLLGGRPDSTTHV